ncbi:MAG: ATPase, T2SS/T4P/T4SS family [Eubacteriales bacterium]
MKIKFNNEYFGVLKEFIEDANVTDINYDGTFVWIDDLMKGKYLSDVVLSKTFIQQLCTRIANVVSCNFNKSDPILEAETDTLRISIIHESVANNGTAISIRKTPTSCRLTRELIKDTQYCSDEVLDFLVACIKGHLNIVFCGLPGSGKTELLKYLTRYIPKEEKVMTIEDNLEIHYAQINPTHHCVELKVDEEVLPHKTAIKVSLRQNTEWILLSEARSVEVQQLVESFSTGLHGLTTLHTDDVRKIPDRILNMIQDSYSANRLENDIYTFVNVGVLIRKTLVGGQIRRYIDQVCIFDRDNQLNTCTMVVDEGKMLACKIPNNIERKLKLYQVELKGSEVVV